MTPEQELLERIRRTLAEADADTDDLVAAAYEEARAEVAGVLRRMMVQDLLGRALRSLGGGAPDPAEPERGAADPSARSSDPGRTADSARRTAGPEPGTAAWLREAFDDPGHDPGGDDPGPGAGPAPDQPAASSGLVTYVFGITPGDAEVAPGTQGLTPLPGGGPPRTVTADGLAALVCDVDPATFEVLGSPGPEGLDTLAAAALAHDGNLAALARGTTVLPLQLGTVVGDDDAVLALLRDHGEQLRGELDRLAGHAEWSVTVQVFEDDDRHGEDAARSASSGSDYLQRRSASLGRRASRFERREQLARHLHERLAAVAVASDTVSARPVDDVAPPLLHGVYLLADDAVDDLERTVAALRREHPEAVIEIGGPWPPYHFSTVELAVPPGAGP